MTKLTLENASSPRGASMGRRNDLPVNKDLPIKLQLNKLRLVDNDYDQGGAYWGNVRGNDMYCAFNEFGVRVFVRGYTRQDAKDNVRKELPNAKFYN